MTLAEASAPPVNAAQLLVRAATRLAADTEHALPMVALLCASKIDGKPKQIARLIGSTEYDFHLSLESGFALLKQDPVFNARFHAFRKKLGYL